MEPMKSCRKCGRKMLASDYTCPTCRAGQLGGTKPMEKTAGKASGKDKTVAVLLALFLGGFGMQYFYLGKKLPGVISLLFCWTFIPALLGVLHGIVLMRMNERHFAELYPD